MKKLKDQDIKDLHWENECEGECYSPYNHTHYPHFELGKDIKETCKKCKKEMKIDAQIYGNSLSESVLYNSYNCECSYKGEKVLYKKRKETLEGIYKIAKQELLNQAKQGLLNQPT